MTFNCQLTLVQLLETFILRNIWGPLLGKFLRQYQDLKGEVSREFDVISNIQSVCLSTETNKKKMSNFVINYHPSAIKLSISASGH